MRRKNYIIYIKSSRTWLFLAYISLVLYLSLQSGDQFSLFSQLWKYDKIVHFVEYLGVGFLMINMLIIHPIKKNHWRFALLFLALFPIFDELLQHYTPNRIPDIYDAITDICGGCVGAYLRKII